MKNMPLIMTKRNGSIEFKGLTIIRSGLGEFLICDRNKTCIGVTRSYGAAIAFCNLI